MAFDNQTRNRLARLVSDCRRLLSDEFSIQLQERNGIQPDGQIMALERLVHLDDEQRGVAALLRERIDHLASGLHDEKQPLKAAIDRLLREQAFTVLNRFAALRMCEERGLVQECVRQGLQSRGFQVYLQVAGSALGDTYQRYRTFLAALFDEISVDLGLLFERYSPFGLLFPREAALEELFQLLNHADLGGVWAEDETIGWMYQYFNSKEERQAMRKASAAPRNSRELAVRNQFFTPRYVVEFLTDNTLGRIWYEMRQGRTRLSEQCRYLVRRPHEVFMQPGEAAPQPPENQDEMSQEELLRQPHYIAFRPGKDPRDLKILDPACGSGHFLLYAFDLLQTIYEEAWELEAAPVSEATGRTLAADYPQCETLILAIPELVLRHNLHGIDIDPRAVQIAALALWLRSQRAWKEQNVKPAERPRILRSHIVCAEPMPGEKGMLKEFTAGLQPPLLGQIVEKIFDRMQLAGEAGSLLKIEEEIQEAIVQAKEQWQRMYERARDKKGNEMLFTQNEMDELAQERQLDLGLFDVSAISEADFWDTVEERILQALSGYAERAGGEHALSRRMFAEDAARGFAFIDLCRKRYDVVLMNPPFGEAGEKSYIYLSQNFSGWNNNLLCAFIERFSLIMLNDAKLGAIFDRTSLVKSTYKIFRENVLLSSIRIESIADLGWEVLDAQVEVTAAVFSNKTLNDISSFLDVRKTSSHEKNNAVLHKISSIFEGKTDDPVYFKNPSNFNYLPNSVIGYDFPVFIIRAFQRFPSLEKQGYKCYQGHALKAEKHFRLWFEIEQNSNQIKYQLYNGSHFTEYTSPLRDVLISPCDLVNLPIDSATVLRNTKFQCRPGIAYGVRGDYLDAHVLPANRIFTVEGQSLPIDDNNDALCLLGFLNSTLFRFGLNLYSGQHKYSGYINLFPFIFPLNKNEVSKYVLQIFSERQFLSSLDETQTYYKSPIIHLSTKPISSLKIINDMLSSVIDTISVKTNNMKENIDKIFEENYHLSENERSMLKIFSQRIPKGTLIFEDLPLNQNEMLSFIVTDLVSYAIGTIWGRWDIRFELSTKLLREEVAPFRKSPNHPSNTLINTKGMAAFKSDLVSEEWLRARPDANSLPPEGSVKNPTIKDEEYPIRISWEGILVDDAFAPEGQTHPEDILRRVREVLDVLWGERAAAIEQEACEILEVKSLRDYFRKPSGFFQDHLKRYSKSRRQAPIYWPLSSENGNYTLWIYYHRLTDQFLYTCVNDYVNPRIEEVSKDLERLRKQMSDKPGLSDTSKTDLSRIESLEDFLLELKAFREELLRVAQLPYKPDLNDGVLITAAPLWKLFRLPKWRKDLMACWDKLTAGDYDWAHLAYAIWPDRVRGKCVTDKSLAIAHDLEALYDDSKAPRRKRAKPQEEDEEDS